MKNYTLVDKFDKLTHKAANDNMTPPNLLKESRKTFKSYRDYIKNKKLPINKSSMFAITYYNYSLITREHSLHNFYKDYKLKNIKLIIDSLSLIHISVRHFYYKNYYANTSTLYRYKAFDFLINDIETILKSIQFNKYLEDKILYDLSGGKTKNIYFKIENTHFCLGFELRKEYNDFYLKTFYIFDEKNILRDDMQAKLLKDSANIKYKRLVNNIQFYTHD